MAKQLKMKNPKARGSARTPIGRFIWCSIAAPKPPTAEYNPGKYVANCMWAKGDKSVKADVLELKKTILRVAREAYKKPNLKWGEFPQSVIKDGNDRENSEYVHDHFYASSTTNAKYPPKVFGPRMADGELSVEAVAKIKDGDHGRLIITVGAYQTKGNHGITAYLSKVQFARSGDPLGAGEAQEMALLDDISVDIDDDEEVEEEVEDIDEADLEDDDEDEDEEEEDEKPKPKPKKKAKAKSKAKAKKKAKKEPEPEPEDEDGEDAFPEEDEDDGFDDSSLYDE